MIGVIMMLQIAWWLLVIIIVGAILVGGVAGFFISRAWFKRYLEKNPPVNEAMIREMMRQMGRTLLKNKYVKYLHQ